MHVFLKEFGILRAFERVFALRTRTLFYAEVPTADVEWLEPLAGLLSAEVTQTQAERLQELRLVSEHELTRASIQKYDERAVNGAVAQAGVKSIELMVAQCCNMNCVYCFAGGGEYDTAGLMTLATAKRGVYFLYDEWSKESHAADERPHILFFGGEPLMGFQTIRGTVEYAESIFGESGVSYGMTTNATLVTDEIAAFLAAHNVYVGVSLDGPPEYHRRNRPLRNGGDSYKATIEKLALLRRYMTVDSGIAVMMPGEDRDKIVQALHENGILHYNINAASGIMLDGVSRSDTKKEYARILADRLSRTSRVVDAARIQDKPALMSALEDGVYRKWFGRALNARIPMLKPLYCGCGRHMVTIDIEGRFYPCQSFVGLPEYRQGSLDAGYVRGIFAEHIAQNNPKCRDCFIRYGCGGGCMYEMACDVPETPGIPPVFRVWDEFCEVKKQELAQQIYLHTALDDAQRQWIRESAKEMLLG